MASTKRNQRGRWLARWKDAAGRWRYTAASPNTKATAQRLAEELERHARRQLAGLEALPPRDGGGTVAELLRWWVKSYASGLRRALPSRAASASTCSRPASQR